MMFTDKTKTLIVDEVEKYLPRLFPGIDKQHPMACFPRAVTFLNVVKQRGDDREMRFVFQAGSASWQIVAPEHDDGVSPTHYSYEFSQWGDIDVLPELHCWVGAIDRKTGEEFIIDTTTQFVRGLAEKKGLKYTMPDLPRFIWSGHGSFPEGCYYNASVEAIAGCMAHFKKNLPF